MAGSCRASPDAVKLLDALRVAPHRFYFFQALRRLEGAYPDSPRIGATLRPGEEHVRLCQEPTLAFAPSTLAGLQSGKEGRPPRLSVFFFGLFGPNGPLPLHLTEYARSRQRNLDDPTFRRFADVFHHRLLSLFYRAWSSSQPTSNLDRPETDRFAIYLGALFGLAMESLRGRDTLPDSARVHHAGLLSARTRHADGLRSILENYFRIPARIREFVGEWLDIPEDGRLRLGESPLTGSLGTTATVGARVWSSEHKFRIEFGPMTRADYDRLAPGSRSLERLVALTRSYVGDEFAWDVLLILAREDVPPLKLGGDGRLGLTTWLIGEEARNDAADLIVNPLPSVA